MDKWWAIRWKREIQFTPPYLGIRSHAEEQPLSVQFRMRILVVFPSLHRYISIGFTTFLFNRWHKHPQRRRRRRCDGGRYYYSTFATNSRNHSHVPPLPVPVYLPSCPYATQPSIVFPLQSHNSLITVLLRWLHRYTLPAAMLRTWFPSPPPIHPNRSHVHARRRKSKQETKGITSFQLIGNRFQYYRVQNLLLCFPWQFFIHQQHGMRWSATSL